MMPSTPPLLLGPAAPPQAAQPAQTAPAAAAQPLPQRFWHRQNDDVLAEIGRHLTAPRDLQHFEQALRPEALYPRGIPGLYAKLFDGDLAQLMAPELAPRLAFFAQYPDGPQRYNLPHRDLFERGISAEKCRQMPDARIFAIRAGLAEPRFEHLTLRHQIDFIAQWRLDKARRRLAAPLRGMLGQLLSTYAEQGPQQQQQQAARWLAELQQAALRDQACWQQLSAAHAPWQALCQALEKTATQPWHGDSNARSRWLTKRLTALQLALGHN